MPAASKTAQDLAPTASPGGEVDARGTLAPTSDPASGSSGEGPHTLDVALGADGLPLDRSADTDARELLAQQRARLAQLKHLGAAYEQHAEWLRAKIAARARKRPAFLKPRPFLLSGATGCFLLPRAAAAALTPVAPADVACPARLRSPGLDDAGGAVPPEAGRAAEVESGSAELLEPEYVYAAGAEDSHRELLTLHTQPQTVLYGAAALAVVHHIPSNTQRVFTDGSARRVLRIALHPDGRNAVSLHVGDSSACVNVWALSSLRAVASFPVDAGARHVALSKHGEMVLVAGAEPDRPVWCYDWRKGVPTDRERGIRAEEEAAAPPARGRSFRFGARQALSCTTQKVKEPQLVVAGVTPPPTPPY